MEVTSFDQIDGVLARQWRHDSGRTQTEFWAEIGVKRDTGNNYERHGRIPEPVRRLLFMRFVAGIPVNGPPASLIQIGTNYSSTRSARERLLEAAASLSLATEQVTAAIQSIQKQEKQHGATN